MVIKAKINTAYGPPNVTSKYSPLADITMETANKSLHEALLDNRLKLLKFAGLLPQTLNLITNWDDAIGNEVETKPPLVVISTNRSLWIKNGIGAFAAQPADQRGIISSSDLRALTARNRQTTSPPMYIPDRIGEAASDRNVYIVVHASEYTTYKRNLAGTNITVVGWEFNLPKANRAPRGVWLCGFGASRYAAIEFCKTLRTQATPEDEGAPWDYAWLFDDNVVAFTGFDGYGVVEDRMDADHVCTGFSGGSVAKEFSENRTWANSEVEAGRHVPRKKMADPITTGLIQQAALWNIDYLTREHLNFSPVFLTSAEDVSLSTYFDIMEIPYHYYDGVTVVKETPFADGSQGAEKVSQARQRLTEWFTYMEGNDPPVAPTPPPPIKVKPQDTYDTPEEAAVKNVEQTLAHYVVHGVLPRAATEIRLAKSSVNVQNTAKSQAVEQITTKAAKQGATFFDPAVLERMMKINGAVVQDVKRINKK